MALEGNLTDFSLEDMFRLLQTGGKSGVLHVEHGGRQVVACFREGALTYAGDAGPVEPAGERLVQGGVISEKQLRQARGLMKIQKRDRAGRRLGRILADEGYVEEPVLRRLVSVQVADALFDLLRWDEGELRFEPGEEVAEADIGISVPVDEALEEARRQLEAWERIRERIPGGDTRFGMAAAPGAKSVDIHLKPEEWLLLCHLHGGRSVAELVALTGRSEFDVARVLFDMSAHGLVVEVDDIGEPVAES